MRPQPWHQWLVSSRKSAWPTRVGELLPGELASFSLAIDNDPLAEQAIDATGFLSLGHLDVLVEVLRTQNRDEWVIAYWDGWARIEETLKAAFGSRMFHLELPLRRYLALDASLDELASFVHTQERYVGPTMLIDQARSVLVITDVDWTVTYVGLRGEDTKRRLAGWFVRHGMPVDTSCGPDTPLPGFEGSDPKSLPLTPE